MSELPGKGSLCPIATLVNKISEQNTAYHKSDTVNHDLDRGPWTLHSINLS
jgi:hypothetical protein